MKKRFLLILAVAVCLLTLVLAIPAMADGAPVTSVMGHNLALEDAVDIIYYVDFQNVPGGAESGVLVWRNPQDSYTYGTEDAKLTSVGKDYGYDKFVFPGVAAKMMTQDIYAVSYVKNGDEVTYSALDKYSVLQYAYNMKGNQTVLPGGTATLDELLTDMLNYGTTAQKHFGYKTDRLANATYYQIKVEGGTLPDGATKGLFQAGESVTLTATIENFDHWENKLGETVGTESTLIITVAGVETYTAVEKPVVYSEGLAFTSNGDGTCYVSGIGTCTDTDIVIPPTSPDGDTVTAIGKGYIKGYGYTGLLDCDQITSVIIPDGVTRIGDDAFHDCSGLTSITIGNGVTSIGHGAFNCCSSLTRITIPNSVTSIGEATFGGCPNLQYNVYDNAMYLGNADNPYVVLMKPTDTSITSCIIHPNTKIICDSAFYNCKFLTSITIPNSVLSIDFQAFSCCSSLTSLTIHDGVTSIGLDAFSGCSSLTSITIPNSVTSITERSFSACSALESITVTGGNPIYHSAGNCIIETATGTLVLGCKSSVIPTDGSVTSIDNWAFSCNSSLTSITIPDSVASIGSDAFVHCTGLTSIIILGGVTRIEYNTFYGCSALTNITIPNSITRIDDDAFDGCSALETITYTGTKAQWNAISKYYGWNSGTGSYTIHCTDGDIAK